MDSGVYNVTDLDCWTRRSWSNGVQVDRLGPLDTLTVTTRNSTYELTIISPASGEVLVRGGRFFPDFTRITVSGSSLGGSCLKVRGIYAGFLLELLHDGRVIRTTRVRSVRSTTPINVH